MLSLATWKVVTCDTFTILPMPSSAIQRLNQLARANGREGDEPSRLTSRFPHDHSVAPTLVSDAGIAGDFSHPVQELGTPNGTHDDHQSIWNDGDVPGQQYEIRAAIPEGSRIHSLYTRATAAVHNRASDANRMGGGRSGGVRAVRTVHTVLIWLK